MTWANRSTTARKVMGRVMAQGWTVFYEGGEMKEMKEGEGEGVMEKKIKSNFFFFSLYFFFLSFLFFGSRSGPF